MQYNEAITTKLPPLLKRLVELLSSYSDNLKATDIEVKVNDADLDDLGNYIATGQTCSFVFELSYKLNTGVKRSYLIEVPRMTNEGTFIIKGKLKMLNSYLTSDYYCNLVGDFMRFDYHMSYSLKTKLFGVYDQVKGKFKDMTFDELKSNYPEMLNLNETQSLKLKIKCKLDYLPTEITEDLVKLFPFIKENPEDIINKRILSVDQSVITAVREKIYDMSRTMSTNFFRNGSISKSSIERAINQVFYNQSNELNDVNSAPNVNPLSFDSANTKVILERHKVGRVKASFYNETMADLIDPIVTPDNANVNRINTLNVATSVREGVIYIKVLNNSFEEIDIPYLLYLSSKVLSYEEVNYVTKSLIGSKELRMVYYLRDKIESPTWDYIQSHPDSRLSVLTRFIPMLNSSDSVRIAMGARMLSQAIPLAKSEPPRVQSGHESDFSSSTTDIKFEGDEGRVTEVTSKYVTIDQGDGVPKSYRVPVPSIGIYDVTAVFAPTVKVGQSVSRGQTIIAQDISKTGITNMGVNALCMLGVYRGYNFEDGIIISESFSKKLSHYSIQDISLRISDRDLVLSILPIGSEVKSKDIVVKSVTSFKGELTSKLMNLLTDIGSQKNIKSNNLVIPNNITEGYITDIKIKYNEKLLRTESLKVIDEFLAKPSVLPDLIPEEYRSEITSVPDLEDSACVISVRMLVINDAVVASKLSNLVGSKGMVSLILPDSEMVRTEDGRVIDVILNPDSIFSRKNVTQISTMQLSLIADEVLKRCKGLSEVTEMRDLLDKYKLDNYTILSDEDLIKSIKDSTSLTYITGCYSRISNKEISDWMHELNISEYTQVIDGKTGRKIRNPMMVSYMYLIKLYMQPQYSNKVYSDIPETPILGKGKLRAGAGLRVGSMETVALLSSDLDQFITRSRSKNAFERASSLDINLKLAGIDLEIINK